MAKTARTVDLEPIDRLEDKVKRLIGLIDRLRGEQARAAEEHASLTRELEAARARLADAEGAQSEMASLREERDLVRTRVAEMLEQLDALNL